MVVVMVMVVVRPSSEEHECLAWQRQAEPFSKSLVETTMSKITDVSRGQP